MNCLSGIFLNILFHTLLSKTKGKATILLFLKYTKSKKYGHLDIFWATLTLYESMNTKAGITKK